MLSECLCNVVQKYLMRNSKTIIVKLTLAALIFVNTTAKSDELIGFEQQWNVYLFVLLSLSVFATYFLNSNSKSNFIHGLLMCYLLFICLVQINSLTVLKCFFLFFPFLRCYR